MVLEEVLEVMRPGQVRLVDPAVCTTFVEIPQFPELGNTLAHDHEWIFIADRTHPLLRLDINYNQFQG